MKTAMKIMLGAAVLLVIVGLVGGCFFNGRGMMDNDNSFGRGMMGDDDCDMSHEDCDADGATMHGGRGMMGDDDCDMSHEDCDADGATMHGG